MLRSMQVPKYLYPASIMHERLANAQLDGLHSPEGRESCSCPPACTISLPRTRVPDQAAPGSDSALQTAVLDLLKVLEGLAWLALITGKHGMQFLYAT